MLRKMISRMIVWSMALSILVLPTATAQATENNYDVKGLSVSTGLVAHWTFDGNYTEAINGLDTKSGGKNITYIDGVHGKAAVFNGKDNYLYVEADPVLNFGNSRSENNDNFTISAWINLGNSKYGDKYLLDKGNNIGWDKNDGSYWTNPYRLKFDTCEPIIELSNWYEEESAGCISEGSSVTRDKHVEGEEWFLLTITYDGSRVKIYHDNTLLTQSVYSEGITFNNDDLYIGTDCRLKDYFKGAVDDLRLYTTTLSYDDVDALYQEGVKANKELVEPTKQLVAYYDFDSNLKDSSSFKNDAEHIAVSGSAKYIIGKNGKALTMTKGNYVRVPSGDQLNLETEFTVSCWLKVDTDGEYPILYRQNPSYSDEDENDWTYSLTMDSWGKGENTDLRMGASLYNPDSWVPDDGQILHTEFYYTDNKLKSTNWLHYTCTYNNGQMISYINGKQFKKSDKSDLINIANASGDLLIGYDNSTFFKGAIDELKIYSSCLSPTDVAKEAKRVDSISLSSGDSKKLKAAIGKGKSLTISSIVLKDGDTGKNSTIKSSDKNIKMVSSNKKVFTVAKDGKLTGVKAGKAKLTISYGSHSVTYNVTVK